MEAIATKILKVNGRDVEFSSERNLLEVIRKSGIEIPTFCYHSELSVYGACRLCLVEVDGRGVMASCSTSPEVGMVIHTDTKLIRDLRKINVELLLANHKRECPTCVRGSNCTLQDLSRRLGIEEIRYKQRKDFEPIDESSPSLSRDPNKCVLCGDCVRMCSEVQGIGAIDFEHRGSKAKVAPAFDAQLGGVECVNCGQCAAVCPTGAITPKQDREDVWDAIHDKNKIVIAQVAPAVRVALGEYFGGAEPGENVEGKLVSALKMMGFDYVFDTTFAADLTIFEEAEEFIGRLTNGGKLPMFTSCCPGWVKYLEMNNTELLGNLSTCRSPQQMFGSVAKDMLPAALKTAKENIVVVSIMPCTAKKFEAKLPKFSKDGIRDVDFVLTTSEVGRMINSAGIHFKELEDEAFDMPFGFGTGAGLIFGATGGVMEAALRYAVEKLEGKKMHPIEFKQVRGLAKVKEAKLKVGGIELSIAVVHTLAAAKKLIEKIQKGEATYHFVEVMACPGGCVSGGGQPIRLDSAGRARRADALYRTDKAMQFQKSQDNHTVVQCYEDGLGGKPNSHKAHELLHTHYEDRNNVFDARYPVKRGKGQGKTLITVNVVPFDAAQKGEKIIAKIIEHVEAIGAVDKIDIDAAFSPSASKKAPGSVFIGATPVEGGIDKVIAAIDGALKGK